MNPRSLATIGLGIVLVGSLIAAPYVLAANPMPTPQQGWDSATIAGYYHQSQGAVSLPAAFMRALRLSDGTHFDKQSNLEKYGFLPSGANDSWPVVGMGSDSGKRENGIPMVGLTCSACHTGQLTYRSTTLRVIGGTGTLNLSKFTSDMVANLQRTANDPAARKRFLAEAEADGYPKNKASAGLDYELSRHAFIANAAKDLPPGTPSGPGIVDALSGIAFNAMTIGILDSGNAKKAAAPTRFPPLWDIWHLDWVQYNAFAHQPMARNVGEAIGLGARLYIVDPVTGKLNPEPERWRSTVNVRALYWIETALETLQAPKWPAGFGAIDNNKVAAGRALFAANCSMCHGVTKIAGTNEWHARVLPLTTIGTDRNQAVAFAKTNFDATKIGLSATTPGAEGLALITKNVKEQAYRDAGIPKSEWPTYNGFDRTEPLAVPCGYKARPLVGIWSTPPYLHNGSVPSVFAMLSQTRPSHPILGNPEYDPTKLGRVQVTIPGYTYTMDTALQGNGNFGHWFTNDKTRPGRIGRALSDAEKYDIIEYLKVATYADYPTRTIEPSAVPKWPCANDRNWAANIPY